MPRNLILAGFMGTGKSTVGPVVAGQLGMVFADSDALIEARDGRSIADIFAGEGEAAFRGIEAAVCRGLAAGSGQVIAVGGGALLDAVTRAALEADSVVVCLSTELDGLLQRVGNDPGRPLFGDRAAVAQLLEHRAAHYASFEYQVDTSDRTPDEVAGEVVRIWKRFN